MKKKLANGKRKIPEEKNNGKRKITESKMPLPENAMPRNLCHARQRAKGKKKRGGGNANRQSRPKKKLLKMNPASLIRVENRNHGETILFFFFIVFSPSLS